MCNGNDGAEMEVEGMICKETKSNARTPLISPQHHISHYPQVICFSNEQRVFEIAKPNYFFKKSISHHLFSLLIPAGLNSPSLNQWTEGREMGSANLQIPPCFMLTHPFHRGRGCVRGLRCPFIAPPPLMVSLLCPLLLTKELRL